VTRVLFTHRYPMRELREACAAGSYPRHHLWGADGLEAAGFRVAYGPFGRRRRLLTHLSWRLGDRLGDLEQEAAIWARAGGDAVVYAGEATLVRGLAALRRVGWGVPLVAVVHSGVGPWTRALDVALCLSSGVRAQLLALGRDPATTPLAAWGPDLAYRKYTSTGEELVVCAGQAERDPATLVAALDGTGLRARVYADARLALRSSREVEVVATDPGRRRHYEEVLEDLRRASVIAIPLARTDRLLALTEIGDALALGKPIVMTRSPAIDFDPERVGCGLSVAPGDVAGWRAALRRLGSDPELRAAMGRRGRAFAERECNADTFRAAVLAAVTAAAGA